jgi:hypothetical protein
MSRPQPCTRNKKGRQVREVEAAVAGLSSLGKLLHEEHFWILVSVCDLRNRVEGSSGERPLDPGDAQDHGDMQGLIASLDRILEHDRFEEHYLLPVIRKAGDSVLAKDFAGQHVSIRAFTSRLRELTMDMLVHGPGNGRWTQFRMVAEELCRLLLEHLHHEEVAILQRLDHVLDVETDRRLAGLFVSSRLQRASPAGARSSH